MGLVQMRRKLKKIFLSIIFGQFPPTTSTPLSSIICCCYLFSNSLQILAQVSSMPVLHYIEMIHKNSPVSSWERTRTEICIVLLFGNYKIPMLEHYFLFDCISRTRCRTYHSNWLDSVRKLLSKHYSYLVNSEWNRHPSLCNDLHIWYTWHPIEFPTTWNFFCLPAWLGESSEITRSIKSIFQEANSSIFRAPPVKQYCWHLWHVNSWLFLATHTWWMSISIHIRGKDEVRVRERVLLKFS